MQIYNVGTEVDRIMTLSPDFFGLAADGVTLASSADVAAVLKSYTAYYTVRPILLSWPIFTTLYKDSLVKMLNAFNTEYAPLDNYNMNETITATDNNGDTVQSRTVDADHNSITATESHNRQTTATAAADMPTVRNYTTTDDDASVGRLSSYTTTSGGTVNTDTTVTPTTSTTVDDMHTTVTTSHTPTTVDGVTADNIHKSITSRTGNIGVTTSQEMLQAELDVRKQSVIDSFIQIFVSKYCFYGGELYAGDIL